MPLLNDPPAGTMTRAQAAQYLGVCENTLAKLERKGDIRSLRPSLGIVRFGARRANKGRQGVPVYFHKQELDKFLARATETQNPTH